MNFCFIFVVGLDGRLTNHQSYVPAIHPRRRIHTRMRYTKSVFKMAASMNPPTILPKSHGASEVATPQGLYGVPDKMKMGPLGAKDQLTSSHPLEFSEINYTKNQQALDMRMLRNTQGLHAPLRLHMEYAVASKIQRLPGLPSSMIALDTLMGTDETIGFEDTLGASRDAEMFGDIHVMMERKLGLPNL